VDEPQAGIVILLRLDLEPNPVRELLAAGLLFGLLSLHGVNLGLGIAE